MKVFAAAALATALALPASAQDGPSEDPVVARVGDREITRSDVQREMSSLPPEYQQMPFTALFAALRDRAIDSALLAGEADRRELAEDPEVQAAIADATRLILRNRLIEETVETAVTDEALREAYDARKADPAFAEDQVKARHILVETADAAAALITELEGGADFAALAEEHSTGPSGPEGGDLGYFTQDQMVGPFADAAFAMAPGEFTSEPVETRFGWHVILVEDRRNEAPSFEATRMELEQQLGRDAVAALLADLRETAAVERFDIDGEPVAPTTTE